MKFESPPSSSIPPATSPAALITLEFKIKKLTKIKSFFLVYLERKEIKEKISIFEMVAALEKRSGDCWVHGEVKAIYWTKRRGRSVQS